MTIQPISAGQLVRHIETGKVGVTTDYPMKRTPRIAVQWIGGSYPVTEDIAELAVIRLRGTSDA